MVLTHLYAAILMSFKANLQIKVILWNSKSGIYLAERKQKQDSTNCNKTRHFKAE